MRAHTPLWSKVKYCHLEVFDMARASVPTNIAMASKCAAKVQAGKACTMAELRATVSLLNTGLKTSRRTLKVAKDQLKEKSQMVRDLLGRVMR